MCKENEEFVDNVLLHCEVACALWSVFFSRFQLYWAMPSCVVDLFAYWWTSGSTRSVVVWKIVLSYLLWCLWRKMNDRSLRIPRGR